MTSLSIQELAEVVGGRLRLADMPPLGGPWEPVGRVVTNIESVSEGDVLLVLPEAHQSSPLCVEQAFASGALGVISSIQKVAPWAGRFCIEVEDVQWSLWQLARYGRQSFDGTVVAVSGIHGKSTAAAMIDCVLSDGATRNWHDKERENRCLPQQMLNWDKTVHHVVYELQAGEAGALDAAAHLCCPHIGVILGAEPTFTTFASVANLPVRYEELLFNLPDDGYAVLDGDAFASGASGTARIPIKTVGRHRGCDVTATHVLCAPGHLSFAVDGQTAQLKVWGRHYLSPALAAWCVGRLQGVSDREIARRLQHFAPLPGRCEVTQHGGVVIVDDTAGGYETVAPLKLLRTVRASGRRIVICGNKENTNPKRERGTTNPKRERGAGNVRRQRGENSEAQVQNWGRAVVQIGGADLLIAIDALGRAMSRAAMDAGMPAAACLDWSEVDNWMSDAISLVTVGDTVLFTGVASSDVEQFKDRITSRNLPAAA